MLIRFARGKKQLFVFCSCCSSVTSFQQLMEVGPESAWQPQFVYLVDRVRTDKTEREQLYMTTYGCNLLQQCAIICTPTPPVVPLGLDLA